MKREKVTGIFGSLAIKRFGPKNLLAILPDEADFDYHEHRRQLGIINTTCWWALDVAITLIIVWVFVSWNNALDHWAFGAIAVQALAMFISIAVASFVFMWSWGSYVSNVEIFRRIRQTAPGKHIETSSIGDHIREFRNMLGEGEVDHDPNLVRGTPYTDSLGEVKDVSLFLSTMAYGIEDLSDGSKALDDLIKSVRDWLQVRVRANKPAHLEICIWPNSVHRELWGVKRTKSAGSKPRWNTSDDVDSINHFLQSFISYCKLFGFIRKMQMESHGLITFSTKQIPRNDIRMFVIKRDFLNPSALFVVFSSFQIETMDRAELFHTAFATNTLKGARAMERIKDKHTSTPTVHRTGNIDSVTLRGENSWRDDELLKNPFQYFQYVFDLPNDWSGIGDVTCDDCHQTIADMHKNEPDWIDGTFKFDTKKAAQTILDERKQRETESKRGVDKPPLRVS